MASNSAATVYIQVIDDIVGKVRDDFINSGIGEAVLRELQEQHVSPWMNQRLLGIDVNVAYEEGHEEMERGAPHHRRLHFSRVYMLRSRS